MELLNKIQKALKAPKGQRNTFGNYNYRSCEDILEAVKPLLGEATLIITDEIVLIGDRYYVKASALLHQANGTMIASATAYAREALTKKGMDEAQITGAASSYARKYALNGLLAIDDTKDADTTNTNGNPTEYITKEQVKKLLDDVVEVGLDKQMFLGYLKIESLEKMPKTELKKAQEAIALKRKKNTEKK